MAANDTYIQYTATSINFYVDGVLILKGAGSGSTANDSYAIYNDPNLDFYVDGSLALRMNDT